VDLDSQVWAVCQAWEEEAKTISNSTTTISNRRNSAVQSTNSVSQSKSSVKECKEDLEEDQVKAAEESQPLEALAAEEAAVHLPEEVGRLQVMQWQVQALLKRVTHRLVLWAVCLVWVWVDSQVWAVWEACGRIPILLQHSSSYTQVSTGVILQYPTLEFRDTILMEDSRRLGQYLQNGAAFHWVCLQDLDKASLEEAYNILLAHLAIWEAEESQQ
jgi:hypothetical protein